jgi:hypothetical protein
MLVEKKLAEEMEANIVELLNWKRKINPAAQVYGGSCIAPFHHLHFDEIMYDIQASIKYKAMVSYSDADAYGKCLESASKI